ncbi:hypothetical protein AAHC03_019091 [Spirometra sp. Aus1]
MQMLLLRSLDRIPNLSSVLTSSASAVILSQRCGISSTKESSNVQNKTIHTFRFVPPKPLWRWHDDRTPCNDPSIFAIPPDEIPPRRELDEQTIKLLERLSLVNFDSEVSKGVIEEAIHFADCLLTPTAFKGTAGHASEVVRENVPPLHSLLEVCESFEQVLREDVPALEDGVSAKIVSNAAVSFENYFVAPPGNQPIHPQEAFDPTIKENV